MVTIIKKGMKKKEIHSLLTGKTGNKKNVDVKKYCGVIKLREDPSQVQKKMRDEWK